MKKTPKVLLVDDNPADVALVCEASAGGANPSQIRHVVDGEKAIAYLRRTEEYAEALRPDLIILDLNLPRKDGRKVLAEIKGDADLRTIPVVIFSTSQAPQDIAGCYELGANCYVSKPMEMDSFFSAIRSIETYWFETAHLPGEDNDGRRVETRFVN
jgi:chemotaxis family two-component system response regulator Rcp1